MSDFDPAGASPGKGEGELQRDAVNVHVGRKIRQRRWLASLTQAELGVAIGVGLQQVHKYESGASRIGASRLWHIAAVLGCDISYFFDGLEDEATGEARPTHGQATSGSAGRGPRGDGKGLETDAFVCP